MACIQPINVLFNVKGNQHQWWFLLCRVGANLFLLTKIVPISCFVNTPKSDDRKYENVDLVLKPMVESNLPLTRVISLEGSSRGREKNESK